MISLLLLSLYSALTKFITAFVFAIKKRRLKIYQKILLLWIALQIIQKPGTP